MSISGATGLSGEVVNQVFFYILAITVFLLALITFLMVYFVIRYHRKRSPQPAEIKENIWLDLKQV